MQENEKAMLNALAQKSYIQIEKKFWGLKTNILYVPTNSKIRTFYLEFDLQNGLRAKQILFAPSAELSSLCKEKLKSTVNGKFRAYLCASKDFHFAAIQLSEYEDFSFKPVGEIRFSVGGEAEQLLHAFI